MSRIYATRNDNGDQVLVAIQCDWCPRTLRPGPHVSDIGWRKGGVAYDWPHHHLSYERDACPSHADELGGP